MMALPRRCAASLRLAVKPIQGLAVSDRRVEDLEKLGPAGKSQTCRASAWQSHLSGHQLLDRDQTSQRAKTLVADAAHYD